MRRPRVILVVLATVALAFLALTSASRIDWVGSYDLSVHVENRGTPIRRVDCEAFPRREEAEAAIKSYRPPESPLWAVEVDPYQGGPVKVPIKLVGRDTGLFRIELSRSQFRYLAVVVTHVDGRRAGRVTEIPDGQVSREVHVTFD